MATGSALAAIPNTERSVLDALYLDSGGDSWTVSTGWEGAAGTECSWQGVTCDAQGDHVVGIVLGDNNLKGTLAGISGLSALQNFDVDNNALGGPIPPLTTLTALQIFDLNTNHFTGSIPSLAGLTALQTFYVGHNLLTGAAPDLSSLTSLHVFFIAGNQLRGPAPVAPNPSALTDANSALCPNFLGPVSKPQTANDLIWDRATDNDPWTEGCTAAPVVAAAATPTPTLSPVPVLVLIGLFGIAGGVLVRYRAA